jgi:acetylornithine/N-succinyldiaminopimelate aminotransferase
MDPLVAEALHSDPRFLQAKKTLIEIASEYQNKLTGVRPPRIERKVSYEALIKKFQDDRGSVLWYPYLGSGLGRGALVELADGSVKYDLISGIGVHWGHGLPELMGTSIDAAVSDKVMQGNLQQNIDSARLAELILQQVHLDHIFFTGSGTMACENALKLAFQKKYPASRLLAFEHCFMGRSTTLSQITDKPAYREGIPLNVQVDYIPFYDPSHHSESISKAVQALKKHLERYPKQHAAICCELIQGEGGINVGHSDFFIALFDIVKEQGITIFIDEVQTFGRTPSLFAFQHFNLEEYADIVTIGKISQVCATLFRDEYKPRPGLLSQTFIGGTSAIHASIKIINSLLENHYLGPKGKIAQLHLAFVEQFDRIATRTQGLIKGPYGIGSMLSFTPFHGDKEKVFKLLKALFEEGLIVFYAGENPTRVRCLLPMGGITFEDIEPICHILERTLLSMVV